MIHGPALVILAVLGLLILIAVNSTPRAGTGSRGPPATGPPYLALGPNDGLREDDLYLGTFLLGATGSGKSSTLAHLLFAAMTRGWGMLILPAKGTDKADYLRLAQEAGRAGDVRVVGPGSGERFDFLNEAVCGAGGIEAGAGLLEDANRAMSRGQAGKSSDPFWENSSARQMKLCLYVLQAAYGRADVRMLYEFVTTLPVGLEQRESNQWESTFCHQTLHIVSEQPDWRDRPDVRLACEYCLNEFPMMSDRTSTSITANTVTLLSRYMHGDVRPLVEGPSTITPQAVLGRSRQIVIVNTPPLVMKEPGRAYQLAWKLSFLREALRRDVRAFPHPVMIVQDEYQLHAVGEIDSLAQAVARSQKLAVVAATQNFPLLHRALSSKEDAQALLGNFQTKLFFNNSCPVTNEMATKIVGQSRQMFFGGGGGRRSDFSLVEEALGIREPGGGMSWSEQLAFDVPPEYFSTQRTGSPAHANLVDVVVFTGGRKLSNGRNWMKAAIRQRRRS